MASLADIYRGFKFTVEMANSGTYLSRTAFQKVSGLKTSVEVVEYREGNNPDRAEKLIGMVSYDAVTFERGLSDDLDFKNWIEAVGASTSARPQSQAGVVPGDALDSEVRRDLTITLYNKKGEVVKKYKLLGAWASEYSIGDFDASSNDVVISTLVVQHHGIVETNA